MNQTLINYTTHLADNTLILSQRNSEWCGHGPVLEQDIAITNISLDLIGQARSLYQYAAALTNADNNRSPGRGEATEDSLAYLRDERHFKNCLITELPRGDWGQTILRQFFFSAYQYLLYGQLQRSSDPTLAAIAEKSMKEVTYHLRWSSEWVIRLGDGTDESHARMLKALDALWNYTGEFFIPAGYETAMAAAGIGVDVPALQQSWRNKVQEIFQEATLPFPPAEPFMHTGGKTGLHTEYLGYILAEMQYLQRAYPGAEW
ncbi:1,2-phenylacetyl-CoA epoxidase subunit PaaC [Paraflavitalea speifideaquila]|uniref:1,2-phenylacetyl-CoA epoxidase subunit PaaC n=1 Tax=Paraflavitalea speifideaquila TaxID=3076558 RepID=UPI0028E7A25D|nr:1,2-phenylacetyl-CoA epoxidase subunit PaaC [Paraflavitalea speifideiaquila]